MTARGPDDSGEFLRENVAFAHRRLAIRDRDGGIQPWQADDDSAVLVYNGELYNDTELRAELSKSGYCFRTRCDTETLMAAWQHWGIECLARLRGMFAFAVYDFKQQRLVLVRDRFGVKPLFLAGAGDELVFASSIAALLKHPSIRREPNWAVVSHYLTTFRLTLGRDTMFQGIQQLRPAEVLTWDLRRDELTIERYWDFPRTICHDATFNEASGELESLLNEATIGRLVSDAPVGMFLSGGVDSSTLATVVRDAHDGKMLGACGGGDLNDGVSTPRDDDFQFAGQCSRHADMDFAEVRVTQQDYRDTWEWMIDETALPLATPSDVIINRLSNRMKRSVGVVLGGEGADELLCGYGSPHWCIEDFRLAKLSNSGQWPDNPRTERAFLQSLQSSYGRTAFIDPADHYLASNSLIPVSAKSELLNPDVFEAAGQDRQLVDFYAKEFAEAADCADESQSLLQQQSILLHRLNLESLLSRLDTATMLASLEARVPYTDHLLVEFAFSLPEAFRIDVDPDEPSALLSAAELDRRGSLRGKRLLRDIASRRMPQALAQRRKASFPTPVQSWMADPWSTWASDRLVNSPFARQVFQRSAMTSLASNVAAAGMWLWPILNVIEWGDRVF